MLDIMRLRCGVVGMRTVLDTFRLDVRRNGSLARLPVDPNGSRRPRQLFGAYHVPDSEEESRGG